MRLLNADEAELAELVDTLLAGLRQNLIPQKRTPNRVSADPLNFVTLAVAARKEAVENVSNARRALPLTSSR